MRADIHPRQDERITALHDYDILDTPRESDFDDIVDLVSVSVSVTNGDAASSVVILRASDSGGDGLDAKEEEEKGEKRIRRM